MNPNQQQPPIPAMYASPPTTPADPPSQPAPAPHFQIDDQVMARHPSVNGQWLTSKLVADPTNPGQVLVEFPDGSQFPVSMVELGPKLARQPLDQPQANATGTVSLLKPEYETFKTILVRLNAESERLFKIPLAVLITMTERLATAKETPSSGKNAIFAGISMFVPNNDTFEEWVQSYILEVQDRENGNSAE